jgi:hypothetical protein
MPDRFDKALRLPLMGSLAGSTPDDSLLVIRSARG